jgi:hypothetical protein
MKQEDFFSLPPRPPHNGTKTSIAAAESVATDAASVRLRVLQFIIDRGELGASSDEAEAALGLTHQSCSARFWELAGKNRKRPELKRIVETGFTRKTRSGRAAAVYKELPR